MPMLFRTTVLATRSVIPLTTVHSQIHTSASKLSPKSLKSLYKRVGIYKDKDDLVEELVTNAVHVDTKRTGIIALNKPSFLPVRKADDSQYSIEEILPRLAEAFGVKELHYVRAPERYVMSFKFWLLDLISGLIFLVEFPFAMGPAKN